MSPPIQLLAAGQNSHNWIPAQGPWVSKNVMAPQARKCWNRWERQEMSFWKSWGRACHGNGWHRMKDTSYHVRKLFLESPDWLTCLLWEFHHNNLCSFHCQAYCAFHYGMSIDWWTFSTIYLPRKWIPVVLNPCYDLQELLLSAYCWFSYSFPSYTFVCGRSPKLAHATLLHSG